MTVNQPLANKEDYRGCCYLGRVSETKLSRMGAILAKIEVFRNCPIWNSHDWVETALRTLRDSGFPVHSEEEVRHGRLQDEMLWQLEDWPGIEGVVEFVGYQYLECVIYSKSRRLRIEGQEWTKRSGLGGRRVGRIWQFSLYLSVILYHRYSAVSWVMSFGCQTRAE